MTEKDIIAGLFGGSVQTLGSQPAVETPTVRVVQFEQPAPAPPAPEAVVTPPAEATPPSAAAVVTDPPATPPVDLKSIFGEEYGDADKVKSLLGELPTLRERIAEYEKKVKAVDENPYIKSRLAWQQEGRDESLHDLVYYNDPAKMTPEQKVALKLQIDHGLSPQEAEQYVNLTYKIGEDYDAEDPSVVQARMQLKIDGGAADKFINQWREQQTQPVPKYDYAAQVQSWTPQIEKSIEGLKGIELIDGIKYIGDDQGLADVRNHLSSVLSTEGVQMDLSSPQDVQALQTMARDHYIARNFDKIVGYLRNEWEKAQNLKNSNVPTPAGNQTPPPAGKSQEAAIFGQIAKGRF